MANTALDQMYASLSLCPAYPPNISNKYTTSEK